MAKKDKKDKGGIPATAITERQLRKLMQKTAGDKALGAWALENGITAQVVSAFMRKTQSAGLKLPEVLGYRPQVVYLPLGETLITTANPPRRATKNPSSKVDHTREPIEKKGREKPEEKAELLKKELKKRKKGKK